MAVAAVAQWEVVVHPDDDHGASWAAAAHLDGGDQDVVVLVVVHQDDDAAVVPSFAEASPVDSRAFRQVDGNETEEEEWEEERHHQHPLVASDAAAAAVAVVALFQVQGAFEVVVLAGVAIQLEGDHLLPSPSACETPPRTACSSRSPLAAR